MGLNVLPQSSRVLVWRLSAFGDIVLTTPLLALLQSYRPDLEIHYAVKSTYTAALAHHPLVHTQIQIQRLDQPLLHRIQYANYSAIFDCQANSASFRFFQQVTGPVYRVDKMNWSKFQMTAFKRKLQIPHIVQRYCKLLEAVGLPTDPGPLHFEIPNVVAMQADQQIMSLGVANASNVEPLAFVLGASYVTKQWPVESWSKLIERVPYPVILLGGRADLQIAQQVLSLLSISRRSLVLNAVGQCDFTMSAALLDRCLAVVTHDTGLMHVAAARRKPVVALWGNTVPELGMTPWMTQHRNVEVDGLWCRPCSKLGYSRCPLGHFSCMKKLAVDWVEEALYALLSENGRLNPQSNRPIVN